MNKNELKSASKFISLVLRHKPETIGVSLDENGWLGVDDLLNGMSKAGKPMTLELLQQIVETSDKNRFSFNDDQTKIRANQGHSVEVDVELKEAVPPEHLYHGTASRFLESIRANGLQPQSRLYVHLSQDEVTAVAVGKRHGKPVVLTIEACKMHSSGYNFYLSENGVWLTKLVPKEFIIF